MKELMKQDLFNNFTKDNERKKPLKTKEIIKNIRIHLNLKRTRFKFNLVLFWLTSFYISKLVILIIAS